MNYWLWFSSLEEIEVRAKHELLAKYQNPERIYHLSKKSWFKIKGISEENWNSIRNSKDTSKIEVLEQKMRKYQIGQVTVADENYPQKLKNIDCPPICLFYVGNWNFIHNQCIGIVGARNATNDGLKNAKKMAEELSSQNISVISGLARGIDGKAHEGALLHEGSTIAVIGSGLDVVYPQENLELYKEIMKNGLIISEYVLGTRPYPMHFPARNRIISGLSDGIIVVEASPKSGALITADFALEQGKNVYAVPGNIDSIQNKGTNALIKEGAILYRGIEDLE